MENIYILKVILRFYYILKFYNLLRKCEVNKACGTLISLRVIKVLNILAIACLTSWVKENSTMMLRGCYRDQLEMESTFDSQEMGINQ